MLKRTVFAVCNNIEALKTIQDQFFNIHSLSFAAADIAKPDKMLTSGYLVETLDGRKLMQKFIKTATMTNETNKEVCQNRWKFQKETGCS